jgi:flagellar protein FliS
VTYPSGNDFLRESVLSASPAQLVTMLYDRLLLDLARAEDAQLSGSWAAASANLLHAQDVVAELSSSLDVTAWKGGPDLLAIYAYLTKQLIAANVGHDVALTRECASLLGPLRWAWLAAAQNLTSATEATGGQSIAVVA